MQDNDHDMLVRMEERLENVENIITGLVTKIEFAPVKLIVFGLVSILLSSIIGAIVATVIRFSK